MYLQILLSYIQEFLLLDFGTEKYLLDYHNHILTGKNVRGRKKPTIKKIVLGCCQLISHINAKIPILLLISMPNKR